MIKPPALRTDMISNALKFFESARTESAAAMKERSVPLIQKMSQPICAGAAPPLPLGALTPPQSEGGELGARASRLCGRSVMATL